MSEEDSIAEDQPTEPLSRGSDVKGRSLTHESIGRRPSDSNAPRQVSRTQLMVAAAAILAISLLLLLVPLPRYGRIFRSATDLWHAPLFALVSFLAIAALHRVGVRCTWKIAAGVWLAFTLGGAMVELLQNFVGRHPTFSDAIANACGACAGILLALRSFGTSRQFRDGPFTRPFIYCTATVLIVAPTIDPLRSLLDATRQWLEVPTLASFETADELRRVTMIESIAYREPEYATDGDWSLKIELDEGKYPGISLEPYADWSDYSTLRMNVFVTGDQPLEMIVKITDRAHNNEHWDRFHQRVSLEPGSNLISVRLFDVASAPRGRQLDLEHVATLSLFSVSLTDRRTIYLDNIRLERMSILPGDE